jgi:hypothetical protein
MTWNIVKTVTNNRNNPNKIVSMIINYHPNSNPVTIANAFNACFSSVAENLQKITTLIIRTHYTIPKS